MEPTSHLWAIITVLLQVLWYVQADWDLALVGGMTRGRVIMRPSPSAEWGSVCSDGFKPTTTIDHSNLNSLAACHSLGMASTMAQFTDTYGPADASAPIWLDAVACNKTTYYLQNCTHMPVGAATTCQHGDDVGITCNVPPSLWHFSLVAGSAPSNGLVLMQPSQNLPQGVVLRDFFDNPATALVMRRAMCTTLGFPVERPSTGTFVAAQGLPRYYNPVSCPPNAEGIGACAIRGGTPYLESETWEDSRNLGLYCDYLRTDTLSASLVGGPYRWAGYLRVRLAVAQAEGSICTRALSSSPDATDTASMNSKTLNAICKTLGFPTATARMAYFENPPTRPYPTLDWADCTNAADLSGCKLAAFDDIPRGCLGLAEAAIDCLPFTTLGSAEVTLSQGFGSTAGQIVYRLNATSPWRTLAYTAVSTSINAGDDVAMITANLAALCRSLGVTSGSPKFRTFGRVGAYPGWGDQLSCEQSGSFRECALSVRGSVLQDAIPAGIDCLADATAAMTRTYRIGADGRVEVRLGSLGWGSICVEEVNAFSAWDAVCASLGLGGGSALRMAGSSDQVPIFLSGLVCPSSAAVGGLDTCAKNPVGSHMCAMNQTLFLDCNNVAVNPKAWRVRLAGGSVSKGYVTFQPNPADKEGSFCASDELSTLLAICISAGITNARRPTMRRAPALAGLGGFFMYDARCDGYYDVSHCSYRHFQAETCDGMLVDCLPVYDDPAEWSVRLVGGAAPSEGRLEIRPNAGISWGTVCGYAWSQAATDAACATLGFGGNVSRQRDINFYGYGTGPIWYSSLACEGGGQFLQNCSYYFNAAGNESSGFYCGHGNDVALQCVTPSITPSRWEFRSRQYDVSWPQRVRVEMRPSPDEEWGSISQRTTLGRRQVAVAACAMLGIGNGNAAFLPPVAGIGPVYAYEFNCASGVTDLRQCTSDASRFSNSLDHSSDLTVDCDPIGTDPRLWAFELRDGASPTSGRLHIRPTPTAEWGTVCRYGFTYFDGVAACRSLGFRTPEPHLAQVYLNASYPTRGRIWLEDMSCGGGPLAYLQNCTDYTFAPSGSACTHADDVWVECYPTIEARLSGGPSSSRGRLEVRNMRDALWGTVCNDGFAKDYASWNAACRTVGFTNVTFALYEDWGSGQGPINLDDVQCPDRDGVTLQECDFSPFGESNCNHAEDAGVDCFPLLPPSGWAFRLSGGISAAGRLEVRPGAGLPWGGVCPSPSFNYTYATWIAACASVGINTSHAVPRRYGSAPASGYMMLDDVRCGINDKTLATCGYTGIVASACEPLTAVGIDCDPPSTLPAQWSVRLADGTSGSNGRVEVRFNLYGASSGEWGTVCTTEAPPTTSVLRAVCAAAGHAATDPAQITSSSPSYKLAPNWQPVHLSNLRCPSSATSLAVCTYNPIFSHGGCLHTADLFVDCFPPTPPPTEAPTAPPTTTTTTTTTPTTFVTTVHPSTTTTIGTSAPVSTSSGSTTRVPTSPAATTGAPSTSRPTTTTIPITTLPPQTTALPTPICNAIRVTVHGGVDITDTDIQRNGIIMTMSTGGVDGGTNGQQWKNITDLQVYSDEVNPLTGDVSTFFRFEDVYVGTREPEGFWANFVDVPAGHSSAGSTVAKVRCSLVNSTAIVCVLPPTNGYALSAAEGIRGRFVMPLGQLLTPPCLSNEMPVVLDVHVEAADPDGFGQAVDAIGTISNGVGALVGALVGASVMEIQFVSIQMQSLCMSELDRRSSTAMRYFISPFIDFNFAAAAFGNIAIAAVAGLAQFGLSVKFMKGRRISQTDAWAAVRFPSLAYGISQIFFMGVCYGTFKLLSEEDDGLMVFAGSVTFVVLVGYFALLLHFIRATVRAKFVQYTQFLSRPATTRWLYPLGFWDPDNIRLSYGHIINPFKAECIRYNLQQFAVGTLVSLLIIVRIDCFVRFILVALVFAASACAYLYARPSRLPPVNFLCAVSQIVMAVWCILCAVAEMRPSKEVERTKLMMALCQVVVILVRVVYDLTITILEESTWRHFRRPDMNSYKDDEALQAEGAKKAFMEGMNMEELLRIGTGGRRLKGRDRGGEDGPRRKGRDHTPTLAVPSVGGSGSEGSLMGAESEGLLNGNGSPDYAEEDEEELLEVEEPPVAVPPSLTRTEHILREGMAGMLDAFPELARERHIQILAKLWDLRVDVSVTDPAQREAIVLSLIAQRVNAAKDVDTMVFAEDNPALQQEDTLGLIGADGAADLDFDMALHEEPDALSNDNDFSIDEL